VIRAFKFFTIANTNTPQPLVYTTVATAVPAASNWNESGSRTVKITVADASLFLVGDWLLLLETNGTNKEKVNIIEINYGSNIITVLGAVLSHSVGSWVAYNSSTNSPYIQTKVGNAAAITIGTDYDMNATTGFHCFVVLTPVASGQPIDFGTARPGSFNPEELGQYWVVGTAGDSYLPSAGIC
jgi:hypothetical protein